VFQESEMNPNEKYRNAAERLHYAEHAAMAEWFRIKEHCPELLEPTTMQLGQKHSTIELCQQATWFTQVNGDLHLVGRPWTPVWFTNIALHRDVTERARNAVLKAWSAALVRRHVPHTLRLYDLDGAPLAVRVYTPK
jgi:hypothetical protein